MKLRVSMDWDRTRVTASRCLGLEEVGLVMVCWIWYGCRLPRADSVPCCPAHVQELKEPIAHAESVWHHGHWEPPNRCSLPCTTDQHVPCWSTAPGLVLSPPAPGSCFRYHCKRCSNSFNDFHEI